jgi:hypothetical protein
MKTERNLDVHGNGTIWNRARSRSGTPANPVRVPVREERVGGDSSAMG